LVLYNDQHGGGGDFVSVGLVNGRVEYRFDVGSGPVAITSDEISMHAWHTLRLRKHRNIGKFFSLYYTHIFFSVLTLLGQTTGRPVKPAA